MDLTAKTSPHAFLGSTAITAPARSQGANASVIPAGWETCVTVLSVKYHAILVHAQMTQKSASATKIIMGQHVTGKLVCASWRLNVTVNTDGAAYGESTRLPSLWPGFDSRRCVKIAVK